MSFLSQRNDNPMTRIQTPPNANPWRTYITALSALCDAMSPQAADQVWEHQVAIERIYKEDKDEG